jgi:hypothetical protein
VAQRSDRVTSWAAGAQSALRTKSVVSNEGSAEVTEPPTRAPQGFKERWARCGARTRGERSGRPCRAAGCGFGRRCALHGGLRVGALWRGQAVASKRPPRRFVLITSGFDLVTEGFERKRRQPRWMVWALPEDLAELLPTAVLAAPADVGYIQVLLERRGVRRDVAVRWPQPLGFRIVRRLAERGRIAFALVVAAKDLIRTGRVRVPKYNSSAYRIEPDEIHRALCAAGCSVTKGKARR